MMAILWMIPIYSVTSWISLVSSTAAPICGAIRDCYEAYAIYMFIALFVAVMEDRKGLHALIIRLSTQVEEEIQAETTAILEGRPIPERHISPPFPCCYAKTKPMSVASTWIYQCKLLAMQFCLLNPILAVSPLFLGFFGINTSEPMENDDGSINWGSLSLWCDIIQNVSICIAFWGLWCFYHGTIKELEWCNPWPKFLCIKGVVFMTYYQAIVIDILSAMGSFSQEAADSYQNLLICIEMLLFSVSHVYIFPTEEWEEGYKEMKEAQMASERRIGFRDTLAMNEFFTDVKQIVAVQEFYEGVEPSEEEEETTGCFGPSSLKNDSSKSINISYERESLIGNVTLSAQRIKKMVRFRSSSDSSHDRLDSSDMGSQSDLDLDDVESNNVSVDNKEAFKSERLSFDNECYSPPTPTYVVEGSLLEAKRLSSPYKRQSVTGVSSRSAGIFEFFSPQVKNDAWWTLSPVPTNPNESTDHIDTPEYKNLDEENNKDIVSNPNEFLEHKENDDLNDDSRIVNLSSDLGEEMSPNKVTKELDPIINTNSINVIEDHFDVISTTPNDL